MLHFRYQIHNPPASCPPSAALVLAVEPRTWAVLEQASPPSLALAQVVCTLEVEVRASPHSLALALVLYMPEVEVQASE